MSNRESKIAIFKAALCCGFAIALRALFLGFLCSLIASLALAMTKNAACKIFHCVMLSVSETSLFVIARGASLVAIKRVEHS
ncbi:MAG: hypothetical protein K2N69_08935 [Helicobacter sp.]|nr:hypothetical protein [Helicobacter sp.]